MDYWLQNRTVGIGFAVDGIGRCSGCGVKAMQRYENSVFALVLAGVFAIMYSTDAFGFVHILKEAI